MKTRSFFYSMFFIFFGILLMSCGKEELIIPTVENSVEESPYIVIKEGAAALQMSKTKVKLHSKVSENTDQSVNILPLTIIKPVTGSAALSMEKTKVKLQPQEVENPDQSVNALPLTIIKPVTGNAALSMEKTKVKTHTLLEYPDQITRDNSVNEISKGKTKSQSLLEYPDQ